jgi:transposase
VKQARDAWKQEQAQWDAERLVFVDETWASTNMSRRYGRAPKGQRLVCTVPHSHWKTTTFVAALRLDGMTAPMVLDGAITGDFFQAYIDQVLIPSLRAGDTVIMDNLSCHKRAGVQAAIEKAGCSLKYLPAYSPDLNPIENAFSKLKALLRKRGARTMEGLWSFLGEATEAFQPTECRNYFAHAGYDC